MITGSAFAADLSFRRAPPVYVPPPPLMTWQAFYAGINAGYIESSRDSFVGTPLFFNAGAGSPALAGGAGSTRVGYTLGGGLEYMPNWSLKAEALYYDLGQQSVSGAILSTIAATGAGGLHRETDVSRKTHRKIFRCSFKARALFAIKVDSKSLLPPCFRLIRSYMYRRCRGCVMAGVFDLKKGAFDSSEAGRLAKAYDIALQGLRVSHDVDQAVVNRLARSIVRVARTEPDCLKNDGTIDTVRLAQRAILRMLQINAPTLAAEMPGEETAPLEGGRRNGSNGTPGPGDRAAAPDGVSKVMMRLFDRTIFAKL